MTTVRIFYQDFLFENMPVDENDNPKIKIKYRNKPSGNAYQISFDKMLLMDKKFEWERLIKSILGKNVEIIDDVTIDNIEILEYKTFYLPAYYYAISKYSRSCVVVSTHDDLTYQQIDLVG